VPSLDCRLGIDVGGTNTDAVILDRNDRLLAKAKVPTTPDVTSGIVAAMDAVLGGAGGAAGTVPRDRITHVMLGTTHATNAVLERTRLRRVAVIRIGGPATHGIRPLFGWPAGLRSAVSAGEIIVDGGIEFDGREIAPFDADAVAKFCQQVAGMADGVAITSVFAPVSARHEIAAEQVVRRELGAGTSVSLSSQIGTVGLLERENATVLNAALSGVAADVALAMQNALAAYQLKPATFFAQNDGTLMALDQALRYPVLTIGSGPANSIRGAAFLSDRAEALVCDVGGTSTDIGMLVNGFPRESAQGVEIGGIRTNFRMPDLVTVALGGGTVLADGRPGAPVRVGPESVGYRLTRQALVFGGSTPTLTDAAVAAGRAAIGDHTLLSNSKQLLTAAIGAFDNMLADAIDRVKTARGDRPLIAVGGGSILVPDQIPGISEVIRPDHFDAANAIGAAIASVSGQVDRITHLGGGGREAALAEASEDARDRAVAAGADPDSVATVEIEEIPLAYLTTPAVRIRVKAAGMLRGL
jgi:N-methylhydantoinase A/oxoprolinase/acetone carboxylase beta subunit